MAARGRKRAKAEACGGGQLSGRWRARVMAARAASALERETSALRMMMFPPQNEEESAPRGNSFSPHLQL